MTGRERTAAAHARAYGGRTGRRTGARSPRARRRAAQPSPAARRGGESNGRPCTGLRGGRHTRRSSIATGRRCSRAPPVSSMPPSKCIPWQRRQSSISSRLPLCSRSVNTRAYVVEWALARPLRKLLLVALAAARHHRGNIFGARDAPAPALRPGCARPRGAGWSSVQLAWHSTQLIFGARTGARRCNRSRSRGSARSRSPRSPVVEVGRGNAEQRRGDARRRGESRFRDRALMTRNPFPFHAFTM